MKLIWIHAVRRQQRTERLQGGSSLSLRRRLDLILSACALLCAPGLAQGSVDIDGTDLAGQQMSVRELMHLDTALALMQSKEKLRARRPSDAGGLGHIALDGGPVSASEGLKLIAIYGVGKKLLAEVMIGSRAHIYVRGQALAVGAKAGPLAYLLRGISGSCVQLEREGNAHTLCLHPGLWTAK